MVYPHHSIEGEKTIVEPLKETDLPAVKALMDDPEVLAILRTTKKELATWVEVYRTYYVDELVFRIRPQDGDTLLGWIKVNGALRPDGTAWPSYMAIAQPFWNKGYGTDALRALMRGLRESHGVAHWFLKTDKDNLRAQRCYQKSGFHPVSESVVDCDVTGRKVARVKMEAHVIMVGDVSIRTCREED
jgi:RimJ/RimL family protein N-acetyltransferase